MLTREGFVVVDMSAPSPLQRSSWKAEAIRRGDLKISGPIPITEDIPLNDEEEKEFAEKGGLEDSLRPHEESEEQSPRPETPPAPTHAPPSIPEQPSALRSNPVEGHVPQVDDVPRRQASRSPPRVRQIVETPRESVVLSTMAAQATPDNPTKAAQKKKRKSGLRNVFRKMFGRKSRDEPEMQVEQPVRKGHSYHHSDPGLLRQSPPREISSGPRILDLPVQELKPLHPLGQHLPFPMNVNAPQGSPPQEYLTFDMQRPRRATLPNVPTINIERRSLDEALGRLSTWEERQDDEPSPSAGIGIALSSPTQATSPMQSRRRSRSAGALRDLMKGRPSVERRRSAEIRYWRESYGEGSIYSRPQTAKTVETIRSVGAQEPTIRERDSDSVLEMSATLVHADEPETPDLEETQPDKERGVQAPVSAFNFGNLKSAFSDEESAPEPVEEIKAPLPLPRSRSRSQSQKRLSIEDRVRHLETKYEDLEFSMRRISTRNNRQTIILENAPKNLRSRDRSRSTRSVSASRSRSTPSIHQEPVHQSSSDTLNPGPTSPLLNHPTASTSDSSDAARQQALQTMYEALKHERSARKALEQQVRTLQHDVADLHALVNKLIISATATSPSYPTPSPDTLITSTEDRLLTPRPPREEGFAYGPRGDVRVSAISRFSVETGSESGFDDGRVEEKSSEGSKEALASPDVWATPKEEGFGSGFFHQQGVRAREEGAGFV